MLRAIDHWQAPVYNEKWECLVCARGNFCQEAALELAHDIAANLIVAGAVPSTNFQRVRSSVLAWMARNDVQGGDMMELGNRYLAWVKERDAQEVERRKVKLAQWKERTRAAARHAA